ncbi:MAG: hypothetical protein ABWY02_10120 [Telluria sp.]
MLMAARPSRCSAMASQPSLFFAFLKKRMQAESRRGGRCGDQGLIIFKYKAAAQKIGLRPRNFY